MGALNFITTLIDLRAPGPFADAHAADVLGMVRHGNSGIAGVRRVAGRLRAAAAGSSGGDELLYTGRTGGHGSGDQQPFGRVAVAVATYLFWFFGASGSLHRDSAGHGRGVTHSFHVCAQAGFWISRDGVRDVRHRFPGLLRLGPPHVHQRHEPVFGFCVFRL